MSFLKKEDGMIPFSSLGIIMLLITGIAIYHFSKVDLQRARSMNKHTADMETFYLTTSINLDLQQITRGAIKQAILNHSISTYGSPINIDEEWKNRKAYEQWRKNLEKDIEQSIIDSIYYSYYQGNISKLNERYDDHLTNFDFSRFLSSKKDLKVKINPDFYDRDKKVQHSLETEVNFYRNGIIGAHNKYTFHEMSLKLGTSVTSGLRPFTMADKAYAFTGIFKKRAPNPLNPLECIEPKKAGYNTVDELAWYLWGIQEVLGFFEANVNHNIKFATDDRASYSLIQLIIAYKELEQFGTFDYIHATSEFIRPWLGSENEGEEFVRVLEKGLNEKVAKEAADMMESSTFIKNLFSRINEIGDLLILSASHLDSATVNMDKGGGFPPAIASNLNLASEGVTQHLRQASDMSRLMEVYDTLSLIKEEVEENKENVESSEIENWGDKIEAQISTVAQEWNDVKEEWKEGKYDLETSKNNLILAKKDLIGLKFWLEDEKCKNNVATSLWFGNENQNYKGMYEILPAKLEETNRLIDSLSDLEGRYNALRYDENSDDYYINYYYHETIRNLKEAKSLLSQAESARETYLAQKYKYDNCRLQIDYKDPKMGGCLSSGYRCRAYKCSPYPCDCTTEEGVTTCETCYRTCYHSCYDCICDKGILEINFREAQSKYEEYMKKALKPLSRAIEDVLLMRNSGETFYDEKGAQEILEEIEKIHGVYTTPTYLPSQETYYSITDIYYAHWNFSHSKNDIPHYILALDINTPLTYNLENKKFDDYGIFHIQRTVKAMERAIEDPSLDVDALQRGEQALEKMINQRYFENLSGILELIGIFIESSENMRTALLNIRTLETHFPNAVDHAYTTFLLPPINSSRLGYQYQGLSVIHDIRLRVDTRPGKIKLPIIGEVGLGRDNSVNPSFPLPYTPVNFYIWGFEITPSFNEEIPEMSTLWLIDSDTNVLTSLLEMKINDKTIPIPLILHKPIMYKFEFTPLEIISKSIGKNYLPPVVVFSVGPFTTRFRDRVEPPDKDITVPILVDLSYSDKRVYLNTSNSAGREVYVFTSAFERVNSLSYPLKTSLGTLKLNGKTFFSSNSKAPKWAQLNGLKLLDEYGWSEIIIDAYATHDPMSPIFSNKSKRIEKTSHVKGSDHIRILLQEDIGKISISGSKYGDHLRVSNKGNKRVDISISGETCTFFKPMTPRSTITKEMWFGTIDPKRSIELIVFYKEKTNVSVEIEMPRVLKEDLDIPSIKIEYP